MYRVQGSAGRMLSWKCNRNQLRPNRQWAAIDCRAACGQALSCEEEEEEGGGAGRGSCHVGLVGICIFNSPRAPARVARARNPVN
ncbi:unnamed protein product [Danaus chrysippus]|uniref:(African queen) hypothetical protein n=1 Tax=Danaus chrysippus TaxID=151541 RepID=A0A8J2R2L2_9NEOP|nr:unnamed protein product [Danaus chrysippus]